GRGRTMIVGLANGSVGYVLEEEDYRAGGYEVFVSFYGPGFEDFIMENVRASTGALAVLH
ncbi:hypothetical protein ACFL4G_13395, partial [Thermodesulfobacteriota bacterium]